MGWRSASFCLGSGLQWLLLSPKAKSVALRFGRRANAAIAPAPTQASRFKPGERPFKQRPPPIALRRSAFIPLLAASLVSVLIVAGAWAAAAAPSGDTEDPPALSGKLDLVEFDSSPFPYRGNEPANGKPFLTSIPISGSGIVRCAVACIGRTKPITTGTPCCSSRRTSTFGGRR